MIRGDEETQKRTLVYSDAAEKVSTYGTSAVSRECLGPFIPKKYTNYRNAMSADERLLTRVK
jgi:hypothetical protein